LAAEFEKDEEIAQFWLTPPRAELSHAAALFGHRYERLSAASEIGPALRRAEAHHGATILHLVVDASRARTSAARIRAVLGQTWE
ncbi:MAG TPA: hypothetical protein VGM44_23470, partial [Polyangiaceae bacterium]